MLDLRNRNGMRGTKKAGGGEPSKEGEGMPCLTGEHENHNSDPDHEQNNGMKNGEGSDQDLTKFLTKDTQQAGIVAEKYLTKDAHQAELVAKTLQKRNPVNQFANKINRTFESIHAQNKANANMLIRKMESIKDQNRQKFQQIIGQKGSKSDSEDDEEVIEEKLQGDLVCKKMWKRRDGLAKYRYSASAWEERVLVLVGYELLYYTIEKTSEDEYAENECPPRSQARGKFDLSKNPVSVYITSDKTSPHPYCLSIKVKHDPAKSGWKMCFHNAEDQLKWLVELSSRLSTKYLQSTNSRSGNDNQSAEEDEYTEEEEEEEEDSESGCSQIDDNDSKLREPLSNSRVFSSQGKKLFVVSLIGFHVVFFVGGFWSLILFDAALTYYFVRNRPSNEELVSSKKRSFSEKKCRRIVKTKRLKRKKKVDTSYPGFSTIEEGSEKAETSNLPKWRVPSENIKVRSGNYLKEKTKVDSAAPLYDCFGCDMFMTSDEETYMSRDLKFPSDGIEKSLPGNVPNYFIITLTLPYDAPKISFSGQHGPSKAVSVSLYFRITKEAVKLLEDDASDSDGRKNACQLWKKWCDCARDPSNEENKSFLGRFKLVPLVLNPDECLPSSMSAYNNKPMLVKRIGVTGLINQHVVQGTNMRVLEFTINFHKFPFIAKQAFSYLTQNVIQNIEAVLGFVVEGRLDDELPEVVVGMGQICRPNPRQFFEKT